MAGYPQLGSAASNSDFEKLHEYQQTRTQEQCRQGQRQKWPHFTVLFKSELLSPDEMGLVKPLMDRAATFTERVAVFHKGHFDRPRPYETDKRLHPCVEKPFGSKAYPSSHAAIASSLSCLLGEIFPHKAQDLKAYGKELGDLRAIVGVHHPSDVKAGQKLGHEICERLKSERDFKEELRILRKAAADL
jgi:acid phosphatase (class A)